MISRRDFMSAMLTSMALPSAALAASPRVGQPQYPPVPPAYARTAAVYGVPSRLLYAVGLQESVLNVAGQHLPYPWTLNVNQSPERFPTYRQAVARLDDLVRQGVRNIDCGAVQVNWRWHSDKLGSPMSALNPWHNLRVGARILRECRDATSDWFQAVGRYHNPSDAARARGYATQVFSRLDRIRHA